MKAHLTIILCTFLLQCKSDSSLLRQSGEVRFRSTYNYFRELTESEIDSLDKSKPEQLQISDTALFELLEKRGAITDNHLDTSFLGLKMIAYESPITASADYQFELESNPETSSQRLFITNSNATYEIDLGKFLLGDRWISALDLDSDGKTEILILEKYYIMGGYNFDLKVYEIQD